MRKFEEQPPEALPSIADNGEATLIIEQEGAEPSLGVGEEQAAHTESRLAWLRRQQLKVALGGVAVSTALTVTTDFHKIEHQIVEAAPWIAGSLIASEVAWIGGAAMMLAGIGSRVGNPFKIRGKMDEIAEKANDSKLFKAGFLLNSAAAVSQAGILTEGIVNNLPVESWGYLGIPLMDLSSTLVIRNKLWKRVKRHDNPSNNVLLENSQPDEKNEQIVSKPETQQKISVRKARESDTERLAEIDLSRYKKVYGGTAPTKDSVMEMFKKRLENTSPDWMFVCEMGGVVEGFVTGFRTNKPMEEFTSWEDCTADGTLENRVDPKGKYVYIANLTVNPKATKQSGEDILMANLMAQGIQEGVEYGYFLSRMPIFSAWVKRQIRQGNADADLTPDSLDAFANQYANMTQSIHGRDVKLDYELRMYEEAGFKMGEVVRNGFEDPQSLNYGVLFKADVPPNGRMKKSKIVRYSMASMLRIAAKRPKILAKLF